MRITKKPISFSKEFYRRTCKILDEVLPDADDVLWATIYYSCRGLVDAEWFKHVFVSGFRKDVASADKIITFLKQFCQSQPKDDIFEKKCEAMIAALIEKTENQRAIINSDLVKGKGNKKKLIQGVIIEMMIQALLPVVEKNEIAYRKVASIVSNLCDKISPRTIQNIHSKYHKTISAL